MTESWSLTLGWWQAKQVWYCASSTGLPSMKRNAAGVLEAARIDRWLVTIYRYSIRAPGSSGVIRAQHDPYVALGCDPSCRIGAHGASLSLQTSTHHNR